MTQPAADAANPEDGSSGGPPPPPVVPLIPRVAAPPAPPTVPGPIVRPDVTPAWPLVLGVIAIVWGGFGVVASLFGAAKAILMGYAAAGAGATAGPGAGMMTAMAAWQPWAAAGEVASVLLAGALLTGGILLTRRRRAARWVLLWWAGLKLAVVLYAVTINFLLQQAQFAYVAASMPGAGPGGTPGVTPATTFTGVSIGLLVMTLVLTGTLPVFCLIWLSRPAVARHVATWRREMA